MKFILRSSQSIIHEARESDQIYLKIIEFFIGHIVTQDNLTASKSKMLPNPMGKGKIPSFPVSLNGVPPYSQYVQETGDDGSKTGGKPIIYEYSYNNIPKKVRFEVVPNISEGGAGIDENGAFLIFKKDWNIDMSKVQDGTLQAGDIVQGMPRMEETKKLVEDVVNQPEFFAHENTHIINVLRSGGVRYIAKGGDKQFQYGTKEYSSSTEELQAYYIEGSYRLNRLLDKPLKEYARKWDMDYIYYLAIRDRRRFMKAFLYVIIERRHPTVWQNSSEEAKRRLIKRIYELYDQYAGSQKIGLRQMVKYLAGSKLKPPRKIEKEY